MDDFDPILPEGFGTRSVGHQQADLESSGTAYQPRTSRPVNRQRRAKAQTKISTKGNPINLQRLLRKRIQAASNLQKKKNWRVYH